MIIKVFKSLTVGLNKFIFTAEQTPYEKLFDENCILDISRVKSTETKALLMGLAVYILNEYRMDTKKGNNSELKHITVLEEAHNLLKNTSGSESELIGKSVEMLTNTIAEIRTYGEGFIYGDKARFIAEMVPGVTEYNAIRDGNWKDFAIAAGLDVASLGMGVVTGGAGYAVIKGGEVAAKEGTKLAVKEIAEAGTKKVVGETAENVTKKIVKESGEIIERTTLEAGDKIDKTKIPKYLEEIEQITNRKITEQQKKLLKNALKENDYAKLSKEARKIASREFNRSRLDLIKKWEKMTGQD